MILLHLNYYNFSWHFLLHDSPKQLCYSKHFIIKEAKWNAFFIYDRFMNLLCPCPFPSLVILSFLKQKRSLTKLGIKNMHATLYLL